MRHAMSDPMTDQLAAWERRLAQFSNRSDSTGYVGRIGVEVLTELRQSREQAEALATALAEAGPPVFLQFSASGMYFECCHCQGAGQDRETVVHADECQWLPAAAALRAYRGQP